MGRRRNPRLLKFEALSVFSDDRQWFLLALSSPDDSDDQKNEQGDVENREEDEPSDEWDHPDGPCDQIGNEQRQSLFDVKFYKWVVFGIRQ